MAFFLASFPCREATFNPRSREVTIFQTSRTFSVADLFVARMPKVGFGLQADTKFRCRRLISGSDSRHEIRVQETDIINNASRPKAESPSTSSREELWPTSDAALKVEA